MANSPRNPDENVPAGQQLTGPDHRADERDTSSSRARVRLPLDLTAPRLARGFIRQLGWPWDPVLADDAELVVSELVTNAIQHAKSSAELRLELTDRVLRIAVRDFEAASSRLQAAGADDENGRGLALVTALSNAWGCHYQPGGGKIVWAELARSRQTR